MTAVSPHPAQLCHPKVTRSGMLEKSSATTSSNAGVRKLSRSITEQNGDNSWPAQLVHLWKHIVVEFTMCVAAHISNPGKTQLQQCVMCTAENILLAVTTTYDIYLKINKFLLLLLLLLFCY